MGYLLNRRELSEAFEIMMISGEVIIDSLFCSKLALKWFSDDGTQIEIGYIKLDVLCIHGMDE